MGSKIWCQVGEFDFHFQNSYGEMCFWKIMLKVRCFKTTGDHRPFWSKFDVKLGSWVIIHTGENSPLEVSTKPLHLPPGSSAGFTPRARSASLMGWVGWDGTGYQKCPSNFFILCEYIGNVYTYIYIYIHVQSVSPTLLWVWKFDVKLESLNFIFKTHMGKCVFEKSR